MKARITLIMFLFPLISFCQVYNMTNGQVVETCSGTFYDSGGATSNYAYAENKVMIFYPANPNSKISFHFTEFDVESGWDYLKVYADSGTTGQLLYNATGTELQGQTIISPVSGQCITFVFTSDYSLNNSGWVAEISCVLPCQDFNINVAVQNAEINGNEISVCDNNDLILNLSGDYINNDAYYHQSDSLTVFSIQYNSDVLYGNSVVVHPVSCGITIINISALDTNDCLEHTSYYVNFLSGTDLDILNSGADTVALSDSVLLNVTFQADTCVSIFPNQFVNNDTIFMPDDVIGNYTSALNINSYLLTQISDVNNIKSICVNMEHSYMGDLTIKLTCPSGQSITMIQYPSGCGNEFLGIPIDVDMSIEPGVGYDYCWTPNSSNGTWVENCAVGDTLPAGDYQVETSFSDLLGCTVNGPWILDISDSLVSDGGYVFSWGITLDSSYVSVDTLTSEITDGYWTCSNPLVSFIDNNINSVQAVPGDTGIYTFYYHSILASGCEDSSAYHIFVTDSVVNVKRIDSKNIFNVYPVPFTKDINIEYFMESDGEINIDLVDVTGIKLQSIYSSVSTNGRHTLIKSLDLPEGVYFVRLSSGNIHEFRKIIKM